MIAALRRLASFVLLAIGCTPATTPTRVPEPTPDVTPTVASPTIAYRLSPVLEGATLVALAVELRFAVDHSGTTRVVLPTEWASERELWKYVRDVQIEGATKVAEDGPSVRVISAEPDAPITMRYRIVSAYDHEPDANDGQPFAPIVRPQWFYAFGEALFAAPERDDDSPVSFVWAGAPEGFAFASDLEQSGTDTLGELRDSIVLGGTDVELYRERIGDGELRVAIRGSYTFTHEAFVAMARKIVAVEREFWNDHGDPFTIVMGPLVAVPGSLSLGGTGRSDGFTILMSTDAPVEPVRHLIAHEYFHTWNAALLGGQQDGEREMLGKWFAEGFTEFYTWRLLLRAGIYSLEDFAAEWNSALAEYAVSPAKNEPNARIAKDYWNDQAVGRLPYRRGPQLAAIWDRRLRAATSGQRGLDDVLHEMRRKIVAPGDTKLAPDAATLFLSTYVELGGPDLSPDVERFIERGETIVLPRDVFGGCVRVENERRPVFELGFDAEATRAAGNVVTGVRKGSAAHRAGLRDGMILIRRAEGTRGDVYTRYGLLVRDGKRERTIRYMPRGKGELDVQQLRIEGARTAEARAACVREVVR